MGLQTFRPSVRLSAETRANKKCAALLVARGIIMRARASTENSKYTGILTVLSAVVGVGKSSGAYRGTILVVNFSQLLLRGGKAASRDADVTQLPRRECEGLIPSHYYLYDTRR